MTSATTKTAVAASNTAGNIIAGFFACGNTITQAGAPATGQFLDNYKGGGGSATGNIAGATAPATGSPVTITWATASTSYCSACVEVQGDTGTESGPNYAGTGTGLGGGTGSWASPANAQGTPDGTFATWTAP